MSVPREVFLRAFAEGGSVLLHGHNNGNPITRLEDLPSEIELAAAEGDTDRQEALIAQMEADLAARQAELDALKAKGGSVSKPEISTKTATGAEPEPNAELEAKLDKLSKDELLAEVAAAGITLPKSVNTKAEIVAFLSSVQG